MLPFTLLQAKQAKTLLRATSKTPKLQAEKLDEIKTSLRNEVMSYLTKFLAENQKELLKLIAYTVKISKTLFPRN